MKKFIMTAAALFAMTCTSCTASAKPVAVDITIDISDQEMYIQTPEGSALWKVSTARPGYSTPIGEYTPYSLSEMHYSKKYDNAPMPHAIFFKGGYAIHGTYDTKHLGRRASHGCVRLSTDNAAVLYELVDYYGMESTAIHIVP